ncbi:MAG: hypothetical protein ACRDL2_10745 [Gaiellaceae bacterium]
MQSGDGGPAMKGRQVPRIESTPDYVDSRGDEAIRLARRYGLKLDLWQRRVLDGWLGVDDGGRWAAPEAALNCARQNGKTEILIARALAGVLVFDEKLIVWTAHELATALAALDRIEALVEENAKLARLVKQVYRSNGKERIAFANGAEIKFRARTKVVGRGLTGDLVIFDEAMYVNPAVIPSLMPTLSGRSMRGNPQAIFAGSAVDMSMNEYGLVWTRIRERGLAEDPRLAYFEWSADGDLEEMLENPELLADPKLWAQANPAMNVRISEEWIAGELHSLDARSFCVERLGIGAYPPTVATVEAGIFDMDVWDRLLDVDSTIAGRPVIAFDATPDRRAASVALAGSRPDGLVHAQLLDHRPGVGWLVARLAELNATMEPREIVCDGKGAAQSLLPALAEAGLTVKTTGASDAAASAGYLFDLVTEERLRHRGGPPLRTAVAGAKKRSLGGAWAWNRTSTNIDISPLCAVSFACWGAAAVEPETTDDVMISFR